MYKIKNLLLVALSLTLTGCVGAKWDSTNYPKPHNEIELERIGKLTGDEGIVIVGEKKKAKSRAAVAVNSYLWRATLDTLHSMPIEKIEPFAGVVMTGWYSVPESLNERFKVTVFILSSDLRSDALRVSVFRQVRHGKDWVDNEPSPQLADSIEEKILLRARAFKVRDQK